MTKDTALIWMLIAVCYVLIVILAIRIRLLQHQIKALVDVSVIVRDILKAQDAASIRALLNIVKFCAVFTVLLISVPCAMAQTKPLPPPAGVPHALPHPDASHGELYDQGCCNGQDCEPIPSAAVRLGDDGWHVEYVSPRDLVGWVKSVVPYGNEKMSRGCIVSDKLHYCYHACAQRQTKPIKPCTGIGGCQQFDFSEPAKVHCLYVDQGAASLSYRFASR
jgi:hypothetical protein